MTKPLLAVYCGVRSRLDEAKALASQLHLPLGGEAEVFLCVLADKLALQKSGCLPVSVELSARGENRDLMRACQPEPGRVIWDLTAGLGRDAALLASRGATLTLIERDPVMFVLLQDALRRTSLKTITLRFGESKAYLDVLTPEAYPDVIYIDPMHPERRKSAQVKKDMQCLQSWIGPDVDSLALLQCARAHVKDRVVVKWPVREAPLMAPNHQFSGKTVRFDVYLGSRHIL